MDLKNELALVDRLANCNADIWVFPNYLIFSPILAFDRNSIQPYTYKVFATQPLYNYLAGLIGYEGEVHYFISHGVRLFIISSFSGELCQKGLTFLESFGFDCSLDKSENVMRYQISARDYLQVAKRFVAEKSSVSLAWTLRLFNLNSI